MQVRLSHCIKGRLWLGQDVISHVPVYVYVKGNYTKGTVIEYYLTPLGEHWELDGKQQSPSS